MVFIAYSSFKGSTAAEVRKPTRNMDTEEGMEQTDDLVVRLYLVRHGESVLNVEGKVTGQVESVCWTFSFGFIRSC